MQQQAGGRMRGLRKVKVHTVRSASRVHGAHGTSELSPTTGADVLGHLSCGSCRKARTAR